MRKTRLLILIISLALLLFSSCELLVKKPPKPKIEAVLIGLDYWGGYTNNEFLSIARQLNGTIRDVKEFGEALEQLASKLNQDLSITYMLQEREIVDPLTFPTKVNVLGKIEEKIEQLEENDLLLVYYAGHGGTGSGDLIVADLPGNKEYDYLDTAVLLEKFNEMSKGNAILILDSCYSGNYVQPYLDPVNYNPRLLTISASSANQDSYEWSIFRKNKFTAYDTGKLFTDPENHFHGVFTTYLLESLGWDHGDGTNEKLEAGQLVVDGSLKPLNQIPVLKNGTITGGDIYSYISKRIKGQRSLTVNGPLDKVIFSTKW
ncbi:MAG: caspase family protein [Sphaerochaetaceae bacterium]